MGGKTLQTQTKKPGSLLQTSCQQLQQAEAAGRQGRGLPGLESEFKASVYSSARPCQEMDKSEGAGGVAQ